MYKLPEVWDWSKPLFKVPEVLGMTKPLEDKWAMSTTDERRHCVRISHDRIIIIEGVNNGTSKISMSDGDLGKVAMPDNVRMEQEDGSENHPQGDDFFTSWSENYTLFVDDKPILKLQQRKEQYIMAPEDSYYYNLV